MDVRIDRSRGLGAGKRIGMEMNLFPSPAERLVWRVRLLLNRLHDDRDSMVAWIVIVGGSIALAVLL